MKCETLRIENTDIKLTLSLKIYNFDPFFCAFLSNSFSRFSTPSIARLAIHRQTDYELTKVKKLSERIMCELNKLLLRPIFHVDVFRADRCCCFCCFCCCFLLSHRSFFVVVLIHFWFPKHAFPIYDSGPSIVIRLFSNSLGNFRMLSVMTRSKTHSPNDHSYINVVFLTQRAFVFAPKKSFWSKNRNQKNWKRFWPWRQLKESWRRARGAWWGNRSG